MVKEFLKWINILRDGIESQIIIEKKVWIFLKEQIYFKNHDQTLINIDLISDKF